MTIAEIYESHIPYFSHQIFEEREWMKADETRVEKGYKNIMVVSGTLFDFDDVAKPFYSNPFMRNDVGWIACEIPFDVVERATRRQPENSYQWTPRIYANLRTTNAVHTFSDYVGGATSLATAMDELDDVQF